MTTQNMQHARTGHQLEKSTERIMPEGHGSAEQYIMYLRHVFTYELAKESLCRTDEVVEIGSGEGYGTNLLSGNCRRIIGFDVCRNTVEHARAKYCCEKCKFKAYDGGRLPIDDGEFDVAVSFQVIEHVYDEDNFVKEAHRALKPGGKFIVATPKGLRNN